MHDIKSKFADTATSCWSRKDKLSEKIVPRSNKLNTLPISMSTRSKGFEFSSKTDNGLTTTRKDDVMESLMMTLYTIETERRSLKSYDTKSVKTGSHRISRIVSHRDTIASRTSIVTCSARQGREVPTMSLRNRTSWSKVYERCPWVSQTQGSCLLFTWTSFVGLDDTRSSLSRNQSIKENQTVTMIRRKIFQKEWRKSFCCHFGIPDLSVEDCTRELAYPVLT